MVRMRHGHGMNDHGRRAAAWWAAAVAVVALHAGTALADTLHVPDAFKTIQAAIDASIGKGIAYAPPNGTHLLGGGLKFIGHRFDGKT